MDKKLKPKKKKLSIREKAANDREIKKRELERVELSGQHTLFSLDEDWKELWKGMPEFVQEDLHPFQSILVHFDSYENRVAFSKLVNQTITDMTKSVWYPKPEIGKISDKRHVGKGLNPKYPVYIISKGRWEQRLTQRSLEEIGVPYHIVVEPQEYDNYAAVIDPDKILVLPFSNLGQGSIPARNWVWKHAKESGAERHWILDDNIRWFYRLNRNLKIRVTDGAIFRAAEEFVDRYENVAIAGFQYFMFAPRKAKFPPIKLNTRVYSMILIKNDIPFKWRGRYNEDTDLSLRALKDGWCTVLFNAFLGDKQTTMTAGGGNTESLYNIKEGEKDGRRLMAESLYEQHPDVTTVTRKWGRWQHHVDYSPFEKNKLILRKGVEIYDGVDNFGMELKVIEPENGKPASLPPSRKAVGMLPPKRDSL